LGDNSLEGLSEGTFNGVKDSLQQLHLHTNNLSTLPSEVFADLTTLTFLDLSENPNLECLPLLGPNVGAQFLILPDGFAEGGTCACPQPGDAGVCSFDCEAGAQGYVCTGGPTPSPASVTSTPVTPVPVLTRSPVPSANAPSTATTSAPTTKSSAVTTAPDASLSTSTPTTTPTTPGSTAGTTGLGSPAPTSDSMCTNGIPGYQVGDACCTPGCAQCGGPECSTSSLSKGLNNHDCCVDTIIANGVECGGDVLAPCINY
ncbi:unnamed protein product, partial [Hapterophycus canaliculatus]